MLNLYSGNQPNIGQSVLYYISFEALLSHLSSQLVASIDKSNYILDNDLFLRLKGDYGDITYIVDTDSERCYFVESIENISGYKRYNLIVDYWGSYIHKVKNDGGVVYEAPNGYNFWKNGLLTFDRSPVGLPTTIELLPPTSNGLPILLVLNIEYTYSQVSGLFTTDSVTTNKMFGILTSRDKLQEIATDFANIYKFTVKLDELTDLNIDCGVTKMWAVPFYEDWTDRMLKSSLTKFYYKKINETGFTDESIYMWELNVNDYILNITQSQKINDTTPQINIAYYAGTLNNFEPVLPENNVSSLNFTIKLKYNLRISSNNVNVCVWNNEKCYDITQSYELSTTSNNGVLTNMEKMSQSLRNLFGMSSGLINTIGGAISGNIPQSITGLQQTTNTITSALDGQSGRKNYASGDAIYTWTTTTTGLQLIKFANLNEYIYNFNKGCTFNKTIDNFVFVDGYIRADIKFLGVPVNAINTIHDRLLQGCKVIQV